MNNYLYSLLYIQNGGQTAADRRLTDIRLL